MDDTFTYMLKDQTESFLNHLSRQLKRTTCDPHDQRRRWYVIQGLPKENADKPISKFYIKPLYYNEDLPALC